MSVLRNVIFNRLRQITCLVIPKHPAVSGTRFVTTETNVNAGKPGENEDSVATQNNTDVGKEDNLYSDMSQADMLTPGVYFPTEDVYETTYDGIKYVDLPCVKMIFTRNNVKMGSYSADGLTSYSLKSCGMAGFKNAEKRSTVAAQTTGYQLGDDILRKNIKHVRVEMWGQTMSRLPALMGLQQAGVNIVSISDKSSHSFYTKSRKAKHKYYKFGRI